jgi:hypothetical protein
MQSKLSPFESLRALKELKESLSKADKKAESIKKDLIKYEEELMSEVREYSFTFSNELLNEMKKQFPDASVSDDSFYCGYHTVHTDFSKQSASVTFSEHKLATQLPLNVSEIMAELKNIEKELRKEIISYDDLVEMLKMAVSEIGGPGRRVNIVRLYRELWKRIQSPGFWDQPAKSRMREYPRHKFIHDLNQLLQKRMKTKDGHILKIYPAATDLCGNFRSALPLPQPKGSVRWYESIEFIKEGSF